MQHPTRQSKGANKKGFVVRDTHKYGKGVFAAKDIKRGEIVYVLGGRKTTLRELVKRLNSSKEEIDDPFQIGRRTYIDLNEISRTFNHSCDPSGGIRKTSELFALRDIKQGEEITYDYSLTIAPTSWKMRCLCGSKRCRKVLGDIRTVPKRQLNEYKRLGALQTYMKSIVQELEEKKYKIPKYEIEALKELKKTDNVSSAR
jgi:uncharacterized protein